MSWLYSSEARRLRKNSERNAAKVKTKPLPLLLEEVLEGLAGVVVTRRGSRGGRGVALLRVRSGGGVFLHGGAEFVKGAVVLGVLGGDALGNRLGALKLRGAIEETTLLAAMQL